MGKGHSFTNILGTFEFNEHFKLKDSKMFTNIEQYKDSSKLDGKVLMKVLEHFKDKKYFNEFYKQNMALTKKDIKEAVKDDLLIIQTVSNVVEIERSINTLIKRLREWYGLYNPEFENSMENQEKFIELVLKNKEKKVKDSMGAEFSKENLEPMLDLAKNVEGLFSLKKEQVVYLEKMMKKVCPNVLAITGAMIGAKLLSQAGGLKQLMLFPASTIQLLGAEKALFRHMKTGARSPKYGFIHEHPLISKNPRKIHGKIARTLADKISLAVKIDYFKGKFIGDKLLKEIEEKFK